MNIIILLEDDFIDSNRVRLRDRRLDHINSVHKAGVGDNLKVGILNGKMGSGRVISIDRRSVELEVILDKDPPKPLDINIVMAMPRPKVFRRLLQDMTTMGIKNINIIKTWKVEKSFWNSPVLDENKMKDTMILGLEQGKDTVLPSVHIYKRFKPFVEDRLTDIIEDTDCLIGHPDSNGNCLRGYERGVTLAIGPEGGFTPYEVDMFKSKGFKTFTLGDRILRVETVIPYVIGKLSNI